MPIPTIAIIGGGASGTITALRLLQKASFPLKVILIEKRAEAIFRGAAYASQLSYEPLNVPAGKMSVYEEQPDDFYQWLLQHKAHDTTITKDSFVSRRWFGDYLTSCIQAAITKKSSQVEFTVVQAMVTDFTLTGAGFYLLRQDDGTMLTVDSIIFATGNEPPSDVISADDRALLGSHYISNPWLVDPFAQVQPNEVVLFIGTGLTTVDHVISLQQRGHTGKIYALSRQGLFPQVHGTTVPYTLSHDVADPDIEVVRQQVLAEIKLASEQKIDWRSVIDALRPHTPRLWQTLTSNSKQLFLKNYRAKWDNHRHRMPQISAQAIEQLRTSQQLTVLSGSIEGVEQYSEQFKLRYRHGATITDVTVDYVINCTGPAGLTNHGYNHVLQQGLQQGLMVSDDTRLGIVTGANGEIIQASGEALPHCYAVGPLRKAHDWETTAIREIRQQANDLAEHMLKQFNAINL